MRDVDNDEFQSAAVTMRLRAQHVCNCCCSPVHQQQHLHKNLSNPYIHSFTRPLLPSQSRTLLHASLHLSHPTVMSASRRRSAPAAPAVKSAFEFVIEADEPKQVTPVKKRSTLAPTTSAAAPTAKKGAHSSTSSLHRSSNPYNAADAAEIRETARRVQELIDQKTATSSARKPHLAASSAKKKAAELEQVQSEKNKRAQLQLQQEQRLAAAARKQRDEEAREKLRAKEQPKQSKPVATKRKRAVESSQEESEKEESSDSSEEDEEEEESEEEDEKETSKSKKRTSKQPPAKKKQRVKSPSPSSASSPVSKPAPQGRARRDSTRDATSTSEQTTLPYSGKKRGRKPKPKATIHDLPDNNGQDRNDDTCALCDDGGMLLVCEKCVHSFHEECLIGKHEDNRATLRELGDDDPLHCIDVHVSCTQRKIPKREKDVAIVDEDIEMAITSINQVNSTKDLAIRWGPKLSTSAGRKYYSSFTRCGDVFRVGSFITLQNIDSEPRDSKTGKCLDFVAQIESMYEIFKTGEKMVECRWLFLPEETTVGRLEKHEKNEVFMTGHMDDNEIGTIQDLCDVYEYEEYLKMEEETMNDKSSSSSKPKSTRDVYFYRESYDNDRGEFRPWISHKGKSTKTSMNRGGGGGGGSTNRRESMTGGGSNKGGVGSIYAQACASLQLSAAPARLPCRDSERERITKFIETGLKRGAAEGGLYLAGVPGTGKTATVVRVIQSLLQRTDLPPFDYVEVNGMKLPEPHALYSAVYHELTGKKASPSKAAILLDTRFRTTNLKRPICVLLVDELDYIMTRQQNVIYNLFDWPGRKSARLIVIGISNTIDLPDMLMPRVHSRLGLTKLHFEPYTMDQILLIIRDRLRDLTAFSEDAIELCARKIASVSGDIRRALQICRRAAELCEEEQMREKEKEKEKKGKNASKASIASSSSSTAITITTDHIIRAISDLQNSNFIHYLSHSATPHEKILLSGMLSSIKFASGAAGGGDTHPIIPLMKLIDDAERNNNQRGIWTILAKSQGVPVEKYEKPTTMQWMHVVQQWSDLKLVNLTFQRGERWPQVQLNLLIEDVEIAFRQDELWDKLRNG